MFSYSIDNGICYLVMTDKSFPKRSAFSYLEDIQVEFFTQYGGRVPTAMRPYCFIEFGKYSFFSYTRIYHSLNMRMRLYNPTFSNLLLKIFPQDKEKEFSKLVSLETYWMDHV